MVGFVIHAREIYPKLALEDIQQDLILVSGRYGETGGSGSQLVRSETSCDTAPFLMTGLITPVKKLSFFLFQLVSSVKTLVANITLHHHSIDFILMCENEINRRYEIFLDPVPANYHIGQIILPGLPAYRA
jgi:hypothetical protein